MNFPRYVYSAVVKKVITGDTVDLTVDLGFHIKVTLRARLFGITAPAMNTMSGASSQSYLETILPVGRPCTVSTCHDTEGSLQRWIARIEVAGGHDVGDNMVSTGHAVLGMY